MYTGYNYGSALQAVATKEVLRLLGYDSEALKLSGSIVAGRDVWLKKCFLAIALIGHLSMEKYIKAYANPGKVLPEEAKAQFDEFYSSNGEKVIKGIERNLIIRS